MKLFHLALVLGLLMAGLAGCTSSGPPSEAVTSPTVVAAPSTPSTAPTTLTGQFQSQAALTEGSATLRVTDAGAVLQLKYFATGQGADLRLMLSPGTLSPDASGGLGLTSSTLIDLGPLDHTASQRVDMDNRMWSALREPVRSVVIYNYADRTAFGTANLISPG